MATISRLSVSLVANTKGLKKGLKSARASVKKFTGQILSLKSAIVGALGAASIGALAKSAVSAFEQQEQAVASLDASIKSMGRNTKGLSRNLQELASQIQNEGILGDEAIIQGTSFLTTYGEISDRLLPRTIRIMADLAAKMGGDTASAAKLLGKASMGLVGSLSIAGISLSDATKESKDFESILREIEAQVGGTNKALGDTASGGIKQFSNAWGDVQEKLGQVIAIGISPFLRKIGADLGGVAFDAKLAGERFRTWITDTVSNLAWLADAFIGLKLVWKGLKLGFAGFVLALVTGLKVIAENVQAFGDFIGVDLVSKESLTDIENAFLSQTETVKDLKSEVVDLHNVIANSPPSIKLKTEIDKFVLDAAVQDMKQRIGFVEGGVFRKDPAQPQGVLQKLEVNTSDNPQIDTTNDKLDRIYGVLRRQPGAVAG